MKTTILASIAAATLALSACAQPVSVFDGVTLDDSPRPETWQFHYQYRQCDPNTWDAPVNSNVWTNWTCETLTNSTVESRRDRRAARDVAEGAEPIDPPVIEDDAPETPPVTDPETAPTPVPAAPPAVDPVANDSSAKGPKPRTGCNGRGCAPDSGRGNSEGNEQSAQDGD